MTSTETTGIATFTTYAGHTLTARVAGFYATTNVDGRQDTIARWNLDDLRAVLAGDYYYAGPASLFAYLRNLAIDARAFLAACDAA